MEREDGWSQEAFFQALPRRIDKIFEIKKKNSWLAPRSAGSPSLLMKEEDGWGYKVGCEMAGIL